MKCSFCNCSIDDDIPSNPPGKNPWECTNCGCIICEDCGTKNQQYGLVKGIMHCIGIECPCCKERVHFEDL